MTNNHGDIEKLTNTHDSAGAALFIDEAYTLMLSGVGPSHVQMKMPDGTVVPAPATPPGDEEPQVIGSLLPSGPTGLRRVDTLEELSTLPDGTVVVWHDSYSGRQAGVLVTDSGGEREIQPVSMGIYECNTDLRWVTPAVWVVTFNDADSALE